MSHNNLHHAGFAAPTRIVYLTSVPCPFGPGDWWLGETPEHFVAIVAPGVLGRQDEDERQRAHWRTVCWPLGVDGPPEDAIPQICDVADLVGLLDSQHHDRVRTACRMQLEQLARYSNTFGGRPDEERARHAAQFVSGVHAELRAAFPDESWHAAPGISAEAVPATAADLLREVDGAGTQPDRAERTFERVQHFYWAAVRAYRDARRDARRIGAQGQRVLRTQVRSSRSVAPHDAPDQPSCEVTGEHPRVTDR